LTRIKQIHGEEVLDSRGNPTVAATCELASGHAARVSVPSGSSKSPIEAVELRDGDLFRYRGLGCRKAAANVSGPISKAVSGRDLDQRGLDTLLVELDGTERKSRLGANAVLSASLSFALAAASEHGVAPYAYFAQLSGEVASRLPRPTVNLFSGGLHAGKQVPIQDVLVLMPSATTIDEILAMTSDVYRAAVALVQRKYGARHLVADEGGLAPAFPNAEAMLEDAVEAIAAAGLRPGTDAVLCVDVASSHFYERGLYRLGADLLEPDRMIEAIVRWLHEFPIVSVEDPLAHDDWDHWAAFRSRVAGQATVLADDLVATNPSRIQKAADMRAADALLLKVNQIGTVTESLKALKVARKFNWQVTVSARSGDTEDSWLADLGVGWGADNLKVGSLTRSERTSKWNRLLSIERSTHLPVAEWRH
jgi:enolase